MWAHLQPDTKSKNMPSVIAKSTYGHDPIRYPIKAIAYVLSRPSLWRIVLRVACIGGTLAMLILILLFATALKPQAQLISPNLEWWAWLVAVLLVLLESAIATGLLLVVSQSKVQTKLFVATMRMEGQWRENEMVAQSTIKDFNLIKKAFLVRVVTFPIQLVPVVGGAIYSAINATFTGWDYMDRYFDAIKLPSRLQRVEVFGADKSDCSALFHSSTYDVDNEYARFGFMVGFFESLPIVGSVVFPLTNAVAAALFASDIERAGGLSCMQENGGSTTTKT
mmetsp:Transcript_19840/g.30075  ORF Transcript_19840/g.30075 Transcript_19840/m.30075 type:complete len:280 (-) Transcript_19840:398-1237(-)